MKPSRIRTALLWLLLLLFGAAIVVFPERYVNCCFQGFSLWAECVLPSLFPFMILALVFIRTGFAQKAALPLKKVTGLFRLPPAAAACFFMSILSGYPAGSRILTEFYESGELSSQDVCRLSHLCSTSGPLFIIGSVGFKMFQDKGLGAKILLAHALAVLSVSLVLSLFGKKSASGALKRAPTDGNLLYDTFYSAIVSVAVAGGFIAFFYVLAQFFCDFRLLYPLEKLFSLWMNPDAASALCKGLMEATTGCRALAASGERLAPALAGFCITFGGVSILAQQLCYLTRAGVKPLRFIAVKFVQAVVCFLLLLLLLRF